MMNVSECGAPGGATTVSDAPVVLSHPAKCSSQASGSCPVDAPAIDPLIPQVVLSPQEVYDDLLKVGLDDIGLASGLVQAPLLMTDIFMIYIHFTVTA